MTAFVQPGKAHWLPERGNSRFVTADADKTLDLITANLALAVTGCHTAVNHFRHHGRAGAIVNVSSHQAQCPVRGALPYATAKADVEGLTKAVAVDQGPAGIRANAVALGSIATERSAWLRREQPNVDVQIAALHPVGRVGTGDEVADVIAFLLSLRRLASSTASSSPSTAAEPSSARTPKPAPPSSRRRASTSDSPSSDDPVMTLRRTASGSSAG